jgi:hypothetical protein
MTSFTTQFIAIFLNWGLYGALSVQLCTSLSYRLTYRLTHPFFQDFYYAAFPNDKLSTKCLVYIVYVIEMVQTILVTSNGFNTFGDGFGDISSLAEVGLDWLTVPIMGGIGMASLC